MRGPRVAAVAGFLSLLVLLTVSQTALAQGTPGRRGGGQVGGQIGGRSGVLMPRGGMTARGDVTGMRRRAPGPFGRGFRSGFAGDGFRRRFDAGFRRRLDAGFPAGPMLGPVGFGITDFDHRFFFGFPHRLGFFGFPHRRFGLFCFDAFCFVDRFAPFGGFGFHDRFFPKHFPLHAAPFGFVPWFGFGFPYAPAPAVVDTVPTQETPRVPDTWPTLGRQLATPAFAPEAGDSLVVERVSVMDVVPSAALRLTWRSAGLEPGEVVLFLADTGRAVLAAQTLRRPPFIALLQPPPGTAYAGVTAVWPDGTTTSRLVPYRARR
jgi:hypothetical protein